MGLIWLLVALAVVGLCIFIARIPREFTVEEEISISAPIGDVLPLITDFRNWEKWSPWLVHEPKAILTYSNSFSQIGSFYTWEGELLGFGKVTTLDIVDSHLAMDVKQKIDFIKPALHSATIRWNLASTDKGTTKLTWKMIGTMPLFLSFLIPIMTHSIKDSYKLGLVLLRGIVDKNAPTCSLVFDGIQKIQDDRWGVYSSFSGIGI